MSWPSLCRDSTEAYTSRKAWHPNGLACNLEGKFSPEFRSFIGCFADPEKKTEAGFFPFSTLWIWSGQLFYKLPLLVTGAAFRPHSQSIIRFVQLNWESNVSLSGTQNPMTNRKEHQAHMVLHYLTKITNTDDIDNIRFWVCSQPSKKIKLRFHSVGRISPRYSFPFWFCSCVW